MSVDLERSIKDRVREIAARQGRTFNDVWKSLVLERFLARLSRSVAHQKLIFKGGVLLAKYVTLGRETIDLDFLLTNSPADIKSVEELINAIIQLPLDDGFSFGGLSVEELPQPHMDYPGFGIAAVAILGGTRTEVNRVGGKEYSVVGFGRHSPL